MRLRCLVIALALLAAFASDSWGQSQEPPKQAPDIKIEQQSDGAKEGQPDTKQQTRATEQAPSVPDKDASKDTDRHADYEAQKRAEEASEYGVFLGRRLKITDFLVALFTFFLVLVGIGQGIFLFRTDRDTHKAADAAKESADVARDSLIYTQRAYVRVANFPWLWRGDAARPGKYFYDITPIVENGGNTQTVDAKININSALRDEPLPEGFDFPFKTEGGMTFIGAHQSIGASNAIILDDDLVAVQSGKKFFYIWGTVTYRDVFPGTPEHVTEFCTQISRVVGDPLDPRELNNPKGTTVEITFRIYPEHQNTN